MKQRLIRLEKLEEERGATLLIGAAVALGVLLLCSLAIGGGQLFRALLDAQLVDTVELAIMPVLLGEGVPLMIGPYTAEQLTLENHTIYPRSGIALLEYTTGTPSS